MEQGYDGETAFRALRSEVERWRASGMAHPLDAEAAAQGDLQQVDDEQEPEPNSAQVDEESQ
jgi:capsid protein